MKWDAIGAVGQILGSLATFVTVGFLAVQMHDSEVDARRAMAKTREESAIQYLTLAASERLAAIHVKVNNAVGRDKQPPAFFIAAKEQAGLTPEEAYTLYVEQLIRWNSLAQTVLHLDDLLPEDRAQFDYLTRVTLLEPTFGLWYGSTKAILDRDAVRYIDNLLAQPN